MATPTIPNGEEYFFPIIYEGNGGGQRVGKFVPFTDSGTINNSCVFDDGSPYEYLSKTFGSDGNRKTFTISVWFKRGNLGIQNFITSTGASSSNRFQISIETDNTINVEAKTSGSTDLYLRTSRTFEDTSKWYHLLLAVDSTATSGADSEKAKLYIDGDLVTSFQSTATYPGDNDNLQWNAGQEHMIGKRTYASVYYDGYLAEFNNVDGQALAPASFGLTDTSTGRWIPSVVKPYPTTTTTFTVTVSNPGSGNKYYIDSSQQATVTLIEGATYRFDQSDSSNAGHPLRFSTTSNGTHGGGTEFTSGVTTVGTPGSSGAYTEITVPTGTATLYYYCTNHSGMGGTANTQDQYGTNGFRLEFGTSSAMGDDTANSNDFSLNNIDATNQTTDSPTQNFATFDPNDDTGTMPLSEGNREVTQSGSSSGAIRGTLAPSSGKYYFEFTAISVAGSDGQGGVGIQLKNESVDAATSIATIGANTYIYRDDGYMINDEDGNSGFTNYGSGAIIGVALDLDNNKLYFSYSSGAGTDGVFENSGDPVAGTGAIYTLPSNQRFAPYLVFKGSSGQNYSLNTGQTSFNTTPPTGFSALQQDNLPETAKGISGLVWTKNRDAADKHQLYDSSRGKHLVIQPDVNTAQQTVTDGLQKFLAGGQQIEDDVSINTSGESYVSWNWVANGGTTTNIDTSGDPTIASVVQVNQTAGLSIIQFEGNLTASQKVGHGLSQAPEWVVCKPLDISSGGWAVYHTALSSASQTLFLDTNGKEASSSTMWQGLAPDSTVINVGANSSSNRNSSMIHYAWHSVDGFSKFGKYTGATNGAFIYTGFLPSFVLVKLVSGASTGNWTLYDSARSPINPITNYLLPDRELVEATNTNREIDFLSNGFKFYGTNANVNTNNYVYLYCAFAKNPFVGDGTNPVTAR